MDKRTSQVVLECLFDLGITVVYAVLAGLIIVAVVASDDGPISLWTASLYASLLPAAVIVLIGFDLIMRLFAERHALRHRARSDQDPKALSHGWFGRKPCFSNS